MMIRFLLSKTGLSIIASILIIGVALGVKYNGTQKKEEKGPAALMVEKIISDTFSNMNELEKSGAIATPSTEKEEVVTENPESDVQYTATDRLSQEIFKRFMAAKQGGKEITNEVSEQIAKEILAENYSDPVKLYTETDMTIASDSSLTGIKKYGNALAKILTTPQVTSENELFIFEKIISGSTINYGEDLLAMKERYLTIKTALLSLPVPLSLATSHANIVNSTVLFMDAIDGMLSIDNDPIGAVTKLAGYDTGMNYLIRGTTDIRNFMEMKGVSFSPTDPGRLIME